MATTNPVDNREEIAKLDESNMLGSIEALADQIKHAWDSTKNLSFTATKPIQNIVVAGMGGSALGPDVIKHVFREQLTVPMQIVNNYTLPGYVNENTLVLLASYSGTTEEVLSCAQDAQAKKAQIMVIASGGDLGKLAADKGYTAYIIDPKHNPSNQPRMAIGYAIMGAIGLFASAGLIELTDDDVADVVAAILKVDEECRVEVPQADNRAKLLALEMIDRRPVLIGSEFIGGAIHASTNQFNENAKIFMDYKVLPEINHHLMEGLDYPKNIVGTHLFVFMQSDLYHQRNQVRVTLTQQAVEKKGIDTLEIKLAAPTKLTQSFESITLFAYTNFYLAMLQGINPSPIPTVDWFKGELKKL